MTAKALCVGINRFANLPQASWLNGCVNDAEDMAAMLLKRPEFAPDDVTVLLDADATKAKVMSALTKLAKNVPFGSRWS
jgi:metacaspase-1